MTDSNTFSDNMDWNEFQAWAMSKMKKDTISKMQACAALGISGEAGEFSDLVKKELFHNKPCKAQAKAMELGDVLFYVAVNARLWGIPLELVMKSVRSKLDARYPDGFDQARAHAHAEQT